MMSQDQVFN